MATRLAALEAEARRESRKAARWVARNGIGSMPGRRSETGESDTRERSTFLSGSSGTAKVCICGHRLFEHDEVTGACPVCSDCTSATEDLERSRGASRRMGSIDAHDTVDDWEQEMMKTGRPYLPIVGRSDSLGPRELATRAKVQHVLTFMLPGHVELLLMRHVERMTWEQMAEELCISYQAVQQRLRVAEQDFQREWTRHKDDPLDWKDAL